MGMASQMVQLAQLLRGHRPLPGRRQGVVARNTGTRKQKAQPLLLPLHRPKSHLLADVIALLQRHALPQAAEAQSSRCSSNSWQMYSFRSVHISYFV